MSNLSRKPKSAGQPASTGRNQGRASPGTTQSELGRYMAVRFKKLSNGEFAIVAQRARSVQKGGRQETEFEFGETYRKGDLIGKTKQSWKTVTMMFPEFADIDEPVTEDELLKLYGMALGDMPTYEVGLKIQSIISSDDTPFRGTVIASPYVLLEPEQSGEKSKKYYLSSKTVQLSLNSNGGRLNQFFLDQRLIERLEGTGGGIWFAKKAVAIAGEVLSGYGSVFTGAAKGALKHALGVGAKHLAGKYAKKYLAKKGRDAAIKRLVGKMAAKLAKLVAFFKHAATAAVLAFIQAFVADLIYQTKKNVRLLNGKNKGTKGIITPDKATTTVDANNAQTIKFEVTSDGAVDWKEAFWKGIVAGSSKAASVVISDAIAAKFKFDLEIDREISTQLGEKAVFDAVGQDLQTRFTNSLKEVLWTASSTYIIDTVQEIALRPETNSDNFASKVTEALQEKLLSSVGSAFLDVAKGLGGGEE